MACQDRCGMTRLPPPRYELTDLYEDDGLRRIRVERRADAEPLRERLAVMAERIAPATSAAYTPYLRQYWALAARHGRDPDEVATVRDWVYALAYPRMRALLAPPGARAPRGHQPGLSLAALKVAVAAVGQLWQAAGHEPPSHRSAWRRWWQVIVRRLQQEPVHATPILREHLCEMVARAQQHADPRIAARDRAILLLGWAAALAPSAIARIQRPHIRPQAARGAGTVLLIPRGDGAVQDRVLLAPAARADLDPTRAVRDWCAIAAIDDGPLFRSVTRGVVASRGLHPKTLPPVITRWSDLEGVGGQSLRSGWIVQALRDGCDEAAVRRHARLQRHEQLEVYRALAGARATPDSINLL